MDPISSVAHNGLGLVAKRAGKLVDAEQDYLKAIRSNPKHAEAHLNDAMTLERLGRTADTRVEQGKFLVNVPFELHDVDEQVRAHLSGLL